MRGINIAPTAIGVLVRSEVQISRAQSAGCLAGRGQKAPEVHIATIHDAKGLEFRAVAVMACDEDVIPNTQRIGSLGDIAELEAMYETQRRLLYSSSAFAEETSRWA